VPPQDSAAATALGLALAVASFLTSLVVAGRDRARLTIRVRRGLTTPALEDALVVEVANAGRRPLGLDPVVQLLLADGAGLVAADPRWYHDAPDDHRLAESQGYLVAIPVAVWREWRDACRAAGERPPRCVGVGVLDSLDRRHRATLPRELAAWFNA
jgi:hypothetical protein